MSSYTPDMEYYENPMYQEYLLSSKRKVLCNPDKVIKELNLKNARNVVDFGMGLGFFIPYLQQKMDREAHLWGVECQEHLIDMVLKKKVDLNIHNFSAVYLEKNETPILPSWIPYPEVIFACFSISTFPNPGLAMDSLIRSMKPGGRLYVIDWAKVEHSEGPAIKEKVSLDKMKYLAELYSLIVTGQFIVSEYVYGIEVKASDRFVYQFYDHRE